MSAPKLLPVLDTATLLKCNDVIGQDWADMIHSETAKKINISTFQKFNISISQERADFKIQHLQKRQKMMSDLSTLESVYLPNLES